MNRYSGGLTVEDLRHAWVMFEDQYEGGRYLPKSMVAALAREWHRSPAAVSDVFRILRRMHRGEEKSPTENSSLYRMMPEEIHFIFTGELPRPQDEPNPNMESATSDLVVLTEIRDILRELVAITRAAWGDVK